MQVQRSTTFGRSRALRATGKVLPGHARSHNRALVLQTLYAGGPRSRADVARETGLTRVTVSDLVSELIAEQLIVELGPREAARPGKPATLIDIARSAHNIIGVDLSDDAVFRGAVIDLDNNVVARAEIHRDGATGRTAVGKVRELIEELRASTSTRLLGVGIGSPGIVTPDGTVASAPNLGWNDLPLERDLHAHLGLPVHVVNDANAATLAEHGSREGDRDLMLVKIGLGVGSGLIVGGRPLDGAHSSAGEIGHVVVGTDDGPPCVCGKRGCLETWLAAPRLTASIADAARDGDRGVPTIEQTLAEAGRRLAIVLAPIVRALDLPEVVLSGPRELLDGPLMQTAAQTLRMRTEAEFTPGVELRMTTHGQDIVIRGAAVLVLSGQLGVS